MNGIEDVVDGIPEVRQRSAIERAAEVLRIERRWLAVHEFGIRGVNQPALAARLREAAKGEGAQFVGRWREQTAPTQPGARRSKVKEWNLKENVQQTVALNLPGFKTEATPAN